jgi:hypothetical protein
VKNNNDNYDIEKNEPSEEAKGNQGTSSVIMNLNKIYQKIAPYLERPEIIKQFLNIHSKTTKKQMIDLIEIEISNSDSVHQTDFRILLNSII